MTIKTKKIGKHFKSSVPEDPQRMCVIFEQHTVTTHMKYYRLVKLVRDPVPKVFIENWSRVHLLPRAGCQVRADVQHKQYCLYNQSTVIHCDH